MQINDAKIEFLTQKLEQEKDTNFDAKKDIKIVRPITSNFALGKQEKMKNNNKGK